MLSPGEKLPTSNAPSLPAVAIAITRVCTLRSRTTRHTPALTVKISTVSSVSPIAHRALTTSGDTAYIALSPRFKYSILRSVETLACSFAGA